MEFDIWGLSTNLKKVRKKIGIKDRQEVLRTQNNKCADCNRELTPKITHFDHILPIAEGGSNDKENVQALCSTCHSIKSHTEGKKRTLKKIKEKKESTKKDSFGFGNLDFGI